MQWAYNTAGRLATLGSLLTIAASLLAPLVAAADEPAKPKLLAEDQVPYPPSLPGGQSMVSETSPDFLKAPSGLKPDVAIAKTAPTVDFMYYPGQNYPGKPWSNWGDSSAVGSKYYSAIGDHLAIRAPDDENYRSGVGTGTAFVFEYDSQSKVLRKLVDTSSLLHLPAGHYTPGKIHSRLDLGSDGWLYFATHRGSEKAAIDRFHYEGDWILRVDPASGKSEVVAHGPVAKHSIPNSMVDPQRMIFYGGTAAGPDAKDRGIQFFAYDLMNRKLLYSGPDGPGRSMILAQSTGRVYYVPDVADGELMRYDAAAGRPPQRLAGKKMGIRAATAETPQGFVYSVSSGQGATDANLWSLNTKTEEVKLLGPAAVGAEAYIASLDVDPTGRYLYYVPGAHGSSQQDNSAVVQFDVETGRKKVIAFLHPLFQQKYGCTLKGTYGTAVSPDGEKLYITWNVSRGTKAWDCCGLSVIHIPATERQP